MTWREFTSLIRCAIPDGDVAKHAEITPFSRLIEDLEYDSFAVTELLSLIEKNFGVDYTTLEHFEERFATCQDLYDGMRELGAEPIKDE